MAIDMIETPDNLIDALGGTQVVAALLDVKQNTVSSWRVRGFPAWAYSPLREAGETLGLAVDSIVFMSRRPKRKVA
jgi:hypothetical protein